jgi:NAD(P)H-nitrite reductase large subunit
MGGAGAFRKKGVPMNHVIIGNGPAGVVAAETLRKLDPGARVTLLGDEPEPPYSRMAIPYYLHREIGEEGTYLRKSPRHFEAMGIALVQARASRVDTTARSVQLGDGRTLAYDRLCIASGSHPVKPPIPGIDAPNVLNCWTLEDARRIAALAAPGARVLQIGAGFIGCIILEALASRGVELTVVEMGDRMVPRMMTDKAGNMIRKWCEAKGIAVHTNERVTSIRPAGNGSGASIATISTGEEISADLIISAAGVTPNVAFLEGTGVAVKTGVVVDSHMRTSVPDVFAAGDVAEEPDFNTGEGAVYAIQPNAVEQGRVAAYNMLGRTAPRSPGNFAFNVLDTLGLISSSFGQWWGAPGGESVESIDERGWRYLSLQFSDDVMIGATSIGLTDHVGVLRGLIQGRIPLGGWKEELLRDPTRVMEAYLARAQAQDRWAAVR